MKRVSIALLVAAAVVIAAAFSGVGRPPAARGDTLPPRLVTTTGHGVVTAVPDDVTVTAGVQTQAATAAEALSQDSQAMNRVVAALRQSGGTKLQTQQVSLSPRTDAQGNVTGFTAQNTVSAHATVAKAGALVDAAVAAGANTVDGPTLGLSDQDALYRQALQKALADAKAKAQALAEAGGFSVGRVSSVTEQSASPTPVMFKAAAGAVDSSTPVEAGTQDVTADVTVVFEIL